MKVRDLIRRLEAAQSSPVPAPNKEAVVTVAGHPGKEVPVGTLKAILRSAGLDEKEKN